MGDGVDGRPTRQGEAWTETDYERLVDGPACEVSLAEIARRLRRTRAGVQGQLRNLVPADLDLPRPVGANRETWLRRALVTDPGYDWRSVLRARLDDEVAALWTTSNDALLRAGWNDVTPLAELAARLEMSEPALVRRLVALGVAADVVDVVDRLGATAGGTVEARARWARAERVEAVYVLVVDDTPRPRPRPGLDAGQAASRRLSVRSHQQWGRRARDRLSAAPVPAGAVVLTRWLFWFRLVQVGLSGVEVPGPE